MDWSTTEFELQLQEHPYDNSGAFDMDICHTVGRGDGASKLKRSHKLWFAEEVETVEDVKQLIQRAGIKGGFKFATRTSGNISNPSKSVAYRFNCSRGSLAKSVADSNRQRRSKTHRPSDPQDVCKCHFYIYRSIDLETYGRWFIQKWALGSFRHHGHPYISPQHQQASISAVPKDEIDRAMDALSMNISVKAIQSIIRRQTGLNLSRHQIQSLRKKICEVAVVGPGSPADKLLKICANSPDIHYRVFTGTMDDQDRVTIYGKKKKDVPDRPYRP
ncbi:MAG: hypothetical protein SGARI_001437, partial [Bacillariaceae sp.]